MNGDGDCLFRALIEQLEFKNMEDKLKYSPLHLRRQMVANFIKNKELYDIVKKGLIENYGLPPDPNGDKDKSKDETKEEEKVGPFSIVSYMKYIAVSKRWEDTICLILISSMWSARISVELSRTLGQIKFRHDLPLEQADLIVVFNSHEQNGHYTAVIRSNEQVMMADKLRYSKRYNITTDVKARLLRGDISGKRLIHLCDD